MTKRKLVALGVVGLVLAGVMAGLAVAGDNPFAGPPPPHRVRHRHHLSLRPARPPLAARVAIGGPVRAIPDGFLGLSMEYWGMPLFTAQPRALARVLALLHAPGDAPLTIRIGGDSADQSLWNPGSHPPRWVFRISRRWLQETARLTHAARLRLILDLNLVTASPFQAAAWARAALSGLPTGSVSAFEIGNEPDLYDRAYWLATISGGGAVLPAAISPRSYLDTFGAYARALRRTTPGIPLIGPAVAKPSRSLAWLRLLANRARAQLGALSAHRYPYSACAAPGAASYPTVARLLSPHAVSSIVGPVAPAVRVAHAAGLPLRLTELNSVTCGGRPRVSDTFATALWAPDALFALLRTGVDSVDVHVRARTINAAFVPVEDGIAARPLVYGLVLFTRALAPGGELLATHATGALRAWTVRTRAGALRLVLVNPGPRPLRVRLPARLATAEVTRLTAADPAARQGERLGGQWLDHTGEWRGTRRVDFPAAGVLRVGADSAALVQTG